MTFGCCVQAVRHAEAFMVLCDSGLSLEARASARAALEHAVTVEWAYFRVGGLDRLANSATAARCDVQGRCSAPARNDTVLIQEVSVQTAHH